MQSGLGQCQTVSPRGPMDWTTNWKSKPQAGNFTVTNGNNWAVHLISLISYYINHIKMQLFSIYMGNFLLSYFFISSVSS
jgi:hypothetical protein